MSANRTQRIWVGIRRQGAGLWCTGGEVGMHWTRIQVGRDLGSTRQGAWSRRWSREMGSGRGWSLTARIGARSLNGNWCGEGEKAAWSKPYGVGWTARGEQSRMRQAAADEGKGRQFCARCSPSSTWQEHRLGFQPTFPSSPHPWSLPEKCLLPCSCFTSKLTTSYCYQLLC